MVQKLLKELNISGKEISVLDPSQSDIFWENTRCLKVFTNLKGNLFRVVVPASEVFDLISRLKPYNVKYFIDWGGNLIWLQIDELNLTQSIIDIFEKSIEKIMKRGKVKAGDKSILDIYIPVLEY